MKSIVQLNTAIQFIASDNGIPDQYVWETASYLNKERVIEFLYDEFNTLTYITFDNYKYLEEYCLEHTEDWF